MSKIKSTVSVVLIFCMCMSCFIISANAKIGDIINYCKYTDIVAFINNCPIRSYNVDGNTVIVAEDLVNYTFDVNWDSVSRTLNISKNDNINVIKAQSNVVRNNDKIGMNYLPCLETDVIVYVNGNRVDGYNLDGSTVIKIDDLSSFGNVSWNGQTREIHLSIPGVSYSYDNLKSYIKKNGTYDAKNKRYQVDISYVSSLFYLSGDVPCIVLGYTIGITTTMVAIDGKTSPVVVHTFKYDSGEKTMMGTYDSLHNFIIEKNEFPSSEMEGVIGILNLSLKSIDDDLKRATNNAFNLEMLGIGYKEY